MWQNFLHWLDENKTLFAYWCIRLVGLGFRFSKKTISQVDRKTGKKITESEKSFEFGQNGSAESRQDLHN